jgi:hypothetical protein
MIPHCLPDPAPLRILRAHPLSCPLVVTAQFLHYTPHPAARNILIHYFGVLLFICVQQARVRVPYVVVTLPSFRSLAHGGSPSVSTHVLHRPAGTL